MRIGADGTWFPLSHAQRSRWFLYRLNPAGRGRHNIVFTVRLRGQLDEAQLAEALRLLAERHPMLRARFTEQDGEPRQSVAFAAEVPCLRIDASRWSEADLHERVAEDTSRPFDRPDVPPVRAGLYRRADGESIFSLAIDHLVCDGWSYWRLLAELGARLDGVTLAEEPTQRYCAFVAWQRTWLDSAEARQQLAYWQDALADDLPVLRLPFAERTAPASGGYRSVSLSLPAELVHSLRALAVRHGSTLFASLLTAYKIALHRFTGQQDIIVGCPVPARGAGEWDDVVGDFVNVLPLRTRIDTGAELGAVMRAVRRSAMQGLSRQDYPFAALVERLRLSGHQKHPAFQVMFAFQKARNDAGLHRLWEHDDGPDSLLRWGDVTLAPFQMPRYVGADGIDLNLQAIEIGDVIRCDFGYDSGRHDPLAIESFVRAFGMLLKSMTMADAQLGIDRLPLLAADEHRRVTREFNANDVSYGPESLIHALFEQQVSVRGDAPALEFDGQTLSYAMLNRRANQVAHYLIAAGVRPDERVGLCVERGFDMVIALLGILKAGGAYVPLDPGYPQDRLAHMLADSAPRLLLSHSSLAPLLPATPVPVVWLDDAHAWQAQPTHDPDPATIGLTARHLAYVIYTSGSTGMPKGAMNQHDGVVNRLLWAQSEFSLDEQDRVLQKTPFGFDVSVWEIFLPLLAGARLVLARPGGHQDPAYLAALIERARITMLHFVPSMLQAFTEQLAPARCASVRYLLCSGEALPAALQNRVLERLPDVALYNLYGPTEAAVDVTYWRCEKPSMSVPIGFPVANTRIYIVDGHLQPVPVGVAGELLIGGIQVGRGYLNRPELTAERFIDDPFDPAGGKLYRTGDLARWRADGAIDYLGRNDFQVKIRGFRIELGEIEAQLAACEGVREAVVLAREDVPGDKRLVAYLAPRDGAQVSIPDLRERLSRQLAEYMVPAAFLLLERLPLTPNGKLDRAALPAPERDALTARAYEPPLGEVEAALAGIWQELLGVERVGRHDHFFELGGHSLSMVQMAARLRSRLGVEMPLRELFDRPVLSVLAAALPAEPRELTPIEPADRHDPLPLSLAQQRLWLLDRLAPAASAGYHMPAALRLDGELDRHALQSALDRIVARHEVLRTRFVLFGDTPAQVVGPADAGFQLADHDLSGLAPAARDAAVAQWSTDEAAAPFDLATGPLIRGRLLRLAPRQNVLLVTQHHIVSDGWSTGVLVRELMALYAAQREGRPDPLAPLAIQYADYAVWQRLQLQGPALEAQLRFWQTHLHGAPALLTLPTVRPRAATQSYAGASVAVALPPALTARLRALAQRHGATLFMTLLAGWSVLLARLSGQSDVVIGTPVANRSRQEIEPLVGFFVNTLALRVRLDEAPDIAALLAQVKATASAAFTHQDLPFDQVVEAVRPVRSLSHHAVFQAMLALNNTRQTALTLGGLTLEALETSRPNAQFDLMLSLTEDGDTLAGRLEYASALFDRGDIERWAAHLLTLLEAMTTADPQLDIDRLPLLSAAEHTRVVRDFNATAMPCPRERLIHELFEEQVRLRGDAPAVEFEGQCLSFDALNRRANQLAHRLIASGVRPDDRVGLCLERGVDMMAGLLGILKAGGAYVPLDPAYPRDRLAHMLADSAPKLLLSQTSLAPLLPQAETPVLWLDDAQAWAAQPAHDPDPRALGLTARHLAYVIYTSGSTGLPKGVMVEHASVINLWTALGVHLGHDPAVLGRVSVNAALSFDSSVKMWVQLLSGACLSIVPQDTRLDGAALLDWIERRRIDVLDCTPLQLQILLREGLLAPHGHRPRAVLVGGEALPADLWRQLALSPATRFFNVYGPTECTVDATIAPVLAPDEAPHIGRPIANARVHIVDRHLQPVPVGVAGELLIGGAGVARGYLNRPELTADRFIDDPFDPAGGKLYRTGDLARWRADGVIDYLGRNDFQVKIRGFRIELGEIEARLAACDGVREAVVLAREDVSGDKRLVAYVAPRDGAQVSVPDLREQLSRQLAEYMVPAAFVLLERLPLTPNGKLDRAALPAPERDALTAREYEPPLGEVEAALAGIWQELLGVERVGRHDHFFELGGNSLQLVKLGFHLRERFQLDMKAGQLYGAGTLKDMASVAGRAQGRPRSGSGAEKTVTLEI